MESPSVASRTPLFMNTRDADHCPTLRSSDKLSKVSPHLPLPSARIVIEEFVLFSLPLKTADDDGGMHIQLVGEGSNPFGGGHTTHCTTVPNLARKEGIGSKLVGLPLLFIRMILIAWVEIIEEGLVAVEVKRDVGQLVKQGEPEVVDAVVAQGEGDHRALGGIEHGGPIEIGLR